MVVVEGRSVGSVARTITTKNESTIMDLILVRGFHIREVRSLLRSVVSVKVLGDRRGVDLVGCVSQSAVQLKMLQRPKGRLGAKGIRTLVKRGLNQKSAV